MTETEKKFDVIRRAYPETISKEQLYRIAHISKVTALHLLQNGLIPCKDTGKKTRRYTIRTDDVITYLIDREIRPEKYGTPDHWYRGRSGYRKSRNSFRYELSSLSEIEKKLFEEYTQAEFASYGDLLSVEETMEITGYSSTAIYRWCNAKKLVGFKISGKFIIPKIGLAEFLILPTISTLTANMQHSNTALRSAIRKRTASIPFSTRQAFAGTSIIPNITRSSHRLTSTIKPCYSMRCFPTLMNAEIKGFAFLL